MRRPSPAHTGIDENLVDPAREHRVGTLKGQATFAAGVTETFAELDRRVQRTTRGLLGLGVLAPLALAGWAVREIALGRATPLRWSSAVWYAHGLFRDYGGTPRRGNVRMQYRVAHPFAAGFGCVIPSAG